MSQSSELRIASENARAALAEWLAEKDGSPCFRQGYRSLDRQRYEYACRAAAIMAGELTAFLDLRGDGLLEVAVEIEDRLERLGMKRILT